MRGELLPPVEVRIGACLCAGTPHSDGDFVYLPVKLPTAAGHAAVRALAEKGDVEVNVLSAILRYAVESWNFVDSDGNDVAVTPGNVDRYLPWLEGGKEAAAKANQLYRNEGGNGPFSSSKSRTTSKNSSPRTPTGSPISRIPRSSSGRRKSSESPSEPASAGAQSVTSP